LDSRQIALLTLNLPELIRLSTLNKAFVKAGLSAFDELSR
jgi:hypothetical protein